MRKPKRNALRDRVRRRLEDLGMSPIEAAQNEGLKIDFLRDLVEGRKESIADRFLPMVARALRWTVPQLLGQVDVYQSDEISADTGSGQLQPQPSSAVIPEVDLHAGAGYAGGIPLEEQSIDADGHAVSRDAVRAKWSVPLPFLRDELRLRTGRATILPIRGDSMIDTLYDGDRALIDHDDTDVSQGGIFALLDDAGSVIVKQVELLHGNEENRRIRCTSRNPRYAPFELVLQDPVRIIGRVACRITRL